MNRPRSSTLGIAILSCLALASAAAAQTGSTGFYLSAKWGKTNVDASVGDLFDSVIDGDEDTQAYEVGWRFSNLVAVQLGYHDLGNLPGFGSPCAPEDIICNPALVPVQAKATAYSLSFVPQLPLTRSLFIFGKVGVVSIDTDIEAITDETEEFLENLSEEDIIYGAGLRLRLLAGLSVFYEFEVLGSDLETHSLGVTYQF